MNKNEKKYYTRNETVISGLSNNYIRTLKTFLSEFKYVIEVNMRDFLISTFYSFAKFSEKRCIRYTLYTEFVISGMC